MCCQSTTDGNVTQAARSLKESTPFAPTLSLRLRGNVLFGVRIQTTTKLYVNSTYPLEIKGDVKQMLVRLRGAATFPSFCHDNGHLGGGEVRSMGSGPPWIHL